MYTELLKYIRRPKLYAPSKGIWDDKHISKGILNAHLNPNHDSASRKPEFMDRSVSWIFEIAPPSEYRKLLDLGCGPGLYAQRFDELGYNVTGIDFSRRSIAYAKKQSEIKGNNIEYLYKNYLTMNYVEKFDLITLIWCNYGELSTENRFVLLNNIYNAIKPKGKLIFDVFNVLHHQNKKERHEWHHYSEGGFWHEKPHVYLSSFYRYDEDNTVLDRTVIISEDKTDFYNVWEHGFTKDTLLTEVNKIGFDKCEFFDDISGDKFTGKADTICVVLTK